MTSSAVVEGTEGAGVPPQEVTLDISDGIATITLNRPDAGNAITAAQREAIIAWLEQFNEDPTVRCVVITGTGRFFCTGADLRNQAPPPPRPADIPEKLVGDVRRAMLRGAIRLIHAILDCEKPVVAAVNGTAAGIGAHIAFACDIVIATEKAKFIEVFARRGLAADGLGTWLLPRLVGLTRARELVLLAEDVPATRAAEINLITRAVPEDAFAAEVAGVARKLAEGPTRAHSANKWLLNRSLDVERHTLAQEEAWIVDVMSNTHDAGEGVASFVERRPTRFRGF
ncbi:MAG: enoyl-CoA hydratase/isomerase family protein [Frankia sp.]|nr:enoyl-CoA hydratase/isomerase family protein [Frankia sp.]